MPGTGQYARPAQPRTIEIEARAAPLTSTWCRCKRGYSRRPVRRVAARRAVLVLIALALGISPALAEIPSPSRELRLERYVTEKGALETIARRQYLSASFSGGSFQEGDSRGGWNPFGTWQAVGGGRAQLWFAKRGFMAGGEAVADA